MKAISKDEFVSRIERIFTGQKAFAMSHYLGSMFVIDFGLCILRTSPRGNVYRTGSLSVGIRNVPWSAIINGRKFTDNRHVTPEIFSELKDYIEGYVLISLKYELSLILGFSSGLVLKVEVSNCCECLEDDLVEFYVHPEIYFTIGARNELLFSSSEI